MKSASPLRYPGGKWRVSAFFERLLALNGLAGCNYVEPYAGGSGLALTLLLTGKVSHIYLNDLDPAIYAFWHSVLYNTDELLHRIAETPLTVYEWDRQKQIYAQGLTVGLSSLGFAMFYINRTSHSGIMNGGLIGGRKQGGAWRMDARFNRADLQRRISRVAQVRDGIHLSNLDALAFLRANRFPTQSLIYLDPPYYVAGKDLYLNAYRHRDHEILSRYVRSIKRRWVVSYDDVFSVRDLYRGYRSRRLELLHNARVSRVGREVMFFADDVRIPQRIAVAP